MAEYSDNKRYFTCKEDLIEAFDNAITEDERFQNRSEALRYLMRKYIEERQLIKCKK